MKLKISLAALAVFLLAVFSISAAIPPAENLLPADTLLMFTVPDCSVLRAAAQRSPQWLLWNDPAMKPFRQDFTAKWDARFLAPLQQALGIKARDYYPLLQGQLTFAVTQNGWNSSGSAMPALLLLLDARDKGNLLATNLAELKQKWIEDGKEVQTKVLEGVPFTVLTLASNTPMPFASLFPGSGQASSTPKVLYLGQYKSLLIVGTSVKAVVSVAAHLNGEPNPALRQNGQFASDELSQFYNAPLYYGWFNAQTIFNVISQAQQSQEDAGPLPVSLNEVLLASGLKGLKSASFTYRESRDGSQMEIFAAAPQAQRQGLLAMVAAAPKNSSPPPFVPADAIKYWRWRVDGQNAWAELQKTLVSISPSALTYLNTLLDVANATAQQKDPSFDIRKNLISNLSDDWIYYAKASAGNSLADMDSAPWMFLFAAKNPDQAALAIKAVAGMAGQESSPGTRDFLGRKIYTIALPPRSVSGGAPVPRSLYCTTSGGYVALSTDVSMVEGYLRSDDGKTKPLSQTPGLLEAAQHVGGMNNGLFGFQNQKESARALFASFKNDPAVGAAALNPLSSMPFFTAGGGIRDMMDFSLLPDYARVSKYFNLTVYSGNTTTEGLDFKFFQPRPPELN
jgi:hypothetical protein